MKQKPLKNYTHAVWGSNPHADWIRLLRIFFAIAVLLLVSCFFFLYRIRYDLVFQVDQQKESEVSVNRELHDRVKRSFRQKQEKTLELQLESITRQNQGM